MTAANLKAHTLPMLHIRVKNVFRQRIAHKKGAINA
jgi:hypothetical protein